MQGATYACVYTDVLHRVPAGVPNEAELLNPVRTIPHSGADSGRNGGWSLLLEHAPYSTPLII